MRTHLVTLCIALLLLTGCKLFSSNNTANSNNTNSSNTAADAKAKGDFSTPRAAVETFFKAASNRDAELLSQCFDADSPGEFRKLREKTSSQKDLEGLSTFVQDAQITDAKESGDRAVVYVKFKARNEEMKMKKSAAGWKILDF